MIIISDIPSTRSIVLSQGVVPLTDEEVTLLFLDKASERTHPLAASLTRLSMSQWQLLPPKSGARCRLQREEIASLETLNLL